MQRLSILNTPSLPVERFRAIALTISGFQPVQPRRWQTLRRPVRHWLDGS